MVPAPKAILLLGRHCEPEFLSQDSGPWGSWGCSAKRSLSRVFRIRDSFFEASVVYKNLICWVSQKDLEVGRRWGRVRLHAWSLAPGRAWGPAALQGQFTMPWTKLAHPPGRLRAAAGFLGQWEEVGAWQQDLPVWAGFWPSSVSTTLATTAEVRNGAVFWPVN